MGTGFRAPLVVVSSLAIVLLGASGCDGGPSRPGTIRGTAQPCVGPFLPGAVYTVPFVSVVSGSRTVATRKNLASPYEFAFTVAPGTYRVVASADGSVQVHVVSGKTVNVALYNTCI